MSNTSFTTKFVVDQSPQQVFDAVLNPREWWGRGIEGGTAKLDDEFVYRYEDLHRSTQKLVEVVPGKRVVWLVTEAKLNFTKDKTEWNDTRVIFDIAKKGKKTELRFTHQGLVPRFECFDACSGAWESYVTESLRKLITDGKGSPDPKTKARSKKA
jgi:hypothetical protein